MRNQPAGTGRSFGSRTAVGIGFGIADTRKTTPTSLNSPRSTLSHRRLISVESGVDSKVDRLASAQHPDHFADIVVLKQPDRGDPSRACLDARWGISQHDASQREYRDLGPTRFAKSAKSGGRGIG